MSMSISLDAPVVMSLGMQTLLSDLFVIIKDNVLLCNVTVLISVEWHFKCGLLPINADQALIT